MAKKKQVNEPENVEEMVLDIRKKFGDEAVGMLNEKPNIDKNAIPSGSIGIDHAIGIGGFPRGRIVEIYGRESYGKTTLALHVIAEAQKKGGKCAFIDAENALDPLYARRIGVKTEQLLISQPDSGEQAMQMVDHMVRAKQMDVIVIDSVAALTPRSEIEGEIGDVKVGALARLMSQSMRVLTGIVAKSGTLVIFINQTRVNIGGFSFAGGPPPEITTGGSALKFYSSLRIDVRRIAAVKSGEEQVGSRTRIKVVKNKVASPFKMAEFDVIYNEGISKEGEILILGEKVGVISKAGAAFKYNYSRS
jgi:recombination protein RecA